MDMDYTKKIETANADEYQQIKENITEDIKKEAAESVEQASPVIKTAVKDACDDLCEKMEAFQETEKETVPAPSAWQTFVNEEKKAIDKALGALGALVGKGVQNAKQNLEEKAEQVFSNTENAIYALKEGAEFWALEKDRLRLEEEAMRKNIEEIQSSLIQMQELMSQDNLTNESKEQLGKLQKNGVDMLLHFDKIYDSVHQANKKSIPYQSAKLFNAARESLTNVKKDLMICAIMKKAAVKEKATGTFAFIVNTAHKVTKKANQYMGVMEKAAKNLYEKGKDMGNTLLHLRGFFGVVDERDMMQKYMLSGIQAKTRSSDSLAQCIVKEMVKDGIDPVTIKQSVELLNKNVNNAIKSKDVQALLKEQRKEAGTEK